MSVGSATSANVTGLAQGAKYYWQVQATNTAGTTQADGGTWRTFSTLPASQLPGAFSKSSPANGATNVNRSVTLSLGSELGCHVVRGLHRDVGGGLHDVQFGRLGHVGDDQPVQAYDVLLAGARPQRRGDDGREQRRRLVVQDAVAATGNR